MMCGVEHRTQDMAGITFLTVREKVSVHNVLYFRADLLTSCESLFENRSRPS